MEQKSKTILLKKKNTKLVRPVRVTCKPGSTGRTSRDYVYMYADTFDLIEDIILMDYFFGIFDSYEEENVIVDYDESFNVDFDSAREIDAVTNSLDIELVTTESEDPTDHDRSSESYSESESYSSSSDSYED